MKEKRMANRGLWISGVTLIAGGITMIFGELWVGVVLTMIGLIVLGIVTYRPRREHVSR